MRLMKNVGDSFAKISSKKADVDAVSFSSLTIVSPINDCPKMLFLVPKLRPPHFNGYVLSPPLNTLVEHSV